MCKYLIISFPEIQSNSEDWTIVVQSLRSEKLKLTQALNAMMAEKESLAISLEGDLFYCFFDSNIIYFMVYCIHFYFIVISDYRNGKTPRNPFINHTDNREKVNFLGLTLYW